MTIGPKQHRKKVISQNKIIWVSYTFGLWTNGKTLKNTQKHTELSDLRHLDDELLDVMGITSLLAQQKLLFAVKKVVF